MTQPKNDKSDLSEVRAVLGRLQRISRNLPAAGAEMAGDASPQPVETVAAEDGSFSRAVGIASLVARVNAAPGPVKAAVSIGPVLAVAAGVAIFADINKREKEPPPPVASLQNSVQANASSQQQASTSTQQASKALQVASDLTASGQVRAARDVLLRVTKEESADVAWALARTYDPNFLVTIRA